MSLRPWLFLFKDDPLKCKVWEQQYRNCPQPNFYIIWEVWDNACLKCIENDPHSLRDWLPFGIHWDNKGSEIYVVFTSSVHGLEQRKPYTYLCSAASFKAPCLSPWWSDTVSQGSSARGVETLNECRSVLERSLDNFLGGFIPPLSTHSWLKSLPFLSLSEDDLLQKSPYLEGTVDFTLDFFSSRSMWFFSSAMLSVERGGTWSYTQDSFYV